MDIFFDQKDFDIALDLSGDAVDLVLTKDSVEDLMQRLFYRLKTQKRDIVWNLNYGIDYLNDVFGMKKTAPVVDMIIRSEIMKEPMVSEIIYFESEVNNYTYACKFTVSLIEEQSTVTYYILTNETGIILTNENGDQLTIRI